MGLQRKTPFAYKVWALLKTCFQISISLVSVMYIMESMFFIPGEFEPTVWTKEAILSMSLPQALFEIVDLTAELIMLRVEDSTSHLPWDSIAHHASVAVYHLFMYYSGQQADHFFIGMVGAAISCQLVGPFYTLHRLRIRNFTLALMTLVVQICYRVPLAVVSLLRAFQYLTYWPSPKFIIPHLFMCMILLVLDIKWTRWGIKNLQRVIKKQREAKMEKDSQKDFIANPLNNIKHVKAL